MFKWIFFDIGSTLVDETEAYDHRVSEMIVGTSITFREFNDTRIALARQGFDGNSAAIKHFVLIKAPWHSEDEVPYHDAQITLKSLKLKGYKLGIIANQNPGALERLKAWNLNHYFEVIMTSAEAGCAKLDKEIFYQALKLARCSSKECIMIGDRLDNDIIPAKSLGMTTIWIRNGLAKYQSPSLGNDVADYQISSLSELLQIL
jgi:putative hydrolase of the HAD superfamily